MPMTAASSTHDLREQQSSSTLAPQPTNEARLYFSLVRLLIYQLLHTLKQPSDEIDLQEERIAHTLTRCAPAVLATDHQSPTSSAASGPVMDIDSDLASLIATNVCDLDHVFLS